VLIESRIVEAATSFSRQVGIQWAATCRSRHHRQPTA